MINTKQVNSLYINGPIISYLNGQDLCSRMPLTTFSLCLILFSNKEAYRPHLIW